MNLEELVTKYYLESRSEARFAEQQAKIDKRFADQTAHIEIQFEENRGDFRTLYWVLSVVVAATMLPQLPRLLILSIERDAHKIGSGTWSRSTPPHPRKVDQIRPKPSPN